MPGGGKAEEIVFIALDKKTNLFSIPWHKLVFEFPPTLLVAIDHRAQPLETHPCRWMKETLAILPLVMIRSDERCQQCKGVENQEQGRSDCGNALPLQAPP